MIIIFHIFIFSTAQQMFPPTEISMCGGEGRGFVRTWDGGGEIGESEEELIAHLVLVGFILQL